MRIDGFSNGQPGSFDFIDVTDEGSSPISTNGSLFIIGTYSSDFIQNVPSSWHAIPSPSSGIEHKFRIRGQLYPFLPNFTTHTTVQCRLQQTDGSETIATTTQHDFIWETGTPNNTDFPDYTRNFLAKSFLCYYKTADEIFELN